MERYPTRHIVDDLQRKMVFVGGPRQVGKTVLALSILQGDENHPAYLNWDYFEDKRDILQGKLPSNQDLIVTDQKGPETFHVGLVALQNARCPL